MCEQCVGEDAFPRRRFLRLAAAGAATMAVAASFDTQIVEAKPKTTTKTTRHHPDCSTVHRDPCRMGCG